MVQTGFCAPESFTVDVNVARRFSFFSPNVFDLQLQRLEYAQAAQPRDHHVLLVCAGYRLLVTGNLNCTSAAGHESEYWLRDSSAYVYARIMDAALAQTALVEIGIGLQDMALLLEEVRHGTELVVLTRRPQHRADEEEWVLQFNADAKSAGSSAGACLDDEHVEEMSATDDSVQLTEFDNNLLDETASLLVEKGSDVAQGAAALAVSPPGAGAREGVSARANVRRPKPSARPVGSAAAADGKRLMTLRRAQRRCLTGYQALMQRKER